MKKSCLIPVLLLSLQAPLPTQAPGEEFQRLAARLASLRLTGAEETVELQEQALRILDGYVQHTLNATPAPDLQGLNRELEVLVVHRPPVGESYRVIALGGTIAQPAFALVANFSLAGPSAVRVYAERGGRFELRAQVDRFQQKEFFDEYLEVVPISTAGAHVFVTITGRTDELHTGSFMAWHYADGRLALLWASDLLEQSSYEVTSRGFELTYCDEPDEEQPRVCRKKLRDRYAWDGHAWRRASREEVEAIRHTGFAKGVSAPQP